ncbi:MAG: TolB family protein [Gemmatimonadota bacterium]
MSVDITHGTRLGFDVSRDGQWITFDLLGQIWILSAAGGDAIAVTSSVRDTTEDLDPVFAPDARLIAFKSDRPRNSGIWTVALETRELRRLDVPATAAMLAWSPDGSKLAYVARDTIRIVSLPGAQTASLQIEGLPAPGVRDPVWSADGARNDGSWIAFIHWPKPACATPPSRYDDECGQYRVRRIPAHAITVSRADDAAEIAKITAIDWTFAFFGKGQERPLWSPASDAVLIDSMLFSFHGSIRRLRYPAGATFAHWDPDSSLVFVRENLLWRSKFDSESGTLGEPRRLSSTPALYPTVALDGTVLFLAPDGWRLTTINKEERALGWPLMYRVAKPPSPLLIRNARVIDGSALRQLSETS